MIKERFESCKLVMGGTGEVMASLAAHDKNTGGRADKLVQAAAAVGCDGKNAVLGIRNIL